MSGSAAASTQSFELHNFSNMDRFKTLFQGTPTYEPIQDEREDDEEEVEEYVDESQSSARFSWVEYSIFLLLGIAMLWAWYVEINSTTITSL